MLFGGRLVGGGKGGGLSICRVTGYGKVFGFALGFRDMRTCAARRRKGRTVSEIPTLGLVRCVSTRALRQFK